MCGQLIREALKTEADTVTAKFIRPSKKGFFRWCTHYIEAFSSSPANESLPPTNPNLLDSIRLSNESAPASKPLLKRVLVARVVSAKPALLAGRRRNIAGAPFETSPTKLIAKSLARVTLDTSAKRGSTGGHPSSRIYNENTTVHVVTCS